jgi:hypothetical protein
MNLARHGNKGNRLEPVAVENGTSAVLVTQLNGRTPFGAYSVENFESPVHRNTAFGAEVICRVVTRRCSVCRGGTCGESRAIRQESEMAS